MSGQARLSQIADFNELASTDTVSLRFEGQGQGRNQQLNGNAEANASDFLTSTMTLPVSFDPVEENGRSESGFNESGDFATVARETGIIIEKAGELVRIKI